MDGSLIDLINFQSVVAEVQASGEELKKDTPREVTPPVPVSIEQRSDDEPGPIKEWRLKQQKTLDEKDSAEEDAVVKLREKAKRELETFHSHHAANLKDQMEKNQWVVVDFVEEAEAQLIWQNSANLDPKPVVAPRVVDCESWGRIWQATKAGSSPSDVAGTTRIRELMALYASKADDTGKLDGALSKLKLTDKPVKGGAEDLLR